MGLMAVDGHIGWNRKLIGFFFFFFFFFCSGEEEEQNIVANEPTTDPSTRSSHSRK